MKGLDRVVGGWTYQPARADPGILALMKYLSGGK